MNNQNLSPISLDEIPDPRSFLDPDDLPPISNLSDQAQDSLDQIVALLASFQDCEGEINKPRPLMASALWGLYDIHKLGFIRGRSDDRQQRRITHGCITAEGQQLAQRLILIYETLVHGKPLTIFNEDKPEA
jgi:hypothetical protein